MTSTLGSRLAWTVAAPVLLLVLAVAACGATTTTSTPPTASATATATATTTPAASASPTDSPASPTPSATAGWVSYTSTTNHLTFEHPAAMKPLECGWTYIDPANPGSCRQGDGFCCVFFRSSDDGVTQGFSDISSNPTLYAGGITRSVVTVDGVTGTRLSGTQTEGQGGGPQVEYDFTKDGRAYNLFAYVGGQSDSLVASAPSVGVFDQMVQTVVFTS
jgi:hypothetical protein